MKGGSDMDKKLLLQMASVGGAVLSAVCGILITQIDNEALKVQITEEVTKNLMNAGQKAAENL